METNGHQYKAVGTHTAAKPTTCQFNGCGQSIKRVFIVEHKETGEQIPVGSNCHYQATGIDTRLVEDNERRQAQTRRTRANMPAAELALLDEARAAIAGLDVADMARRNTGVFYDLRDWDRRWSPANMELAAWLKMVCANMANNDTDDCPLRAAILAGVTSIDFDTVSGKAMKSRFAGTCGTCGAGIAKGADIVYNGRAHCASHAA